MLVTVTSGLIKKKKVFEQKFFGIYCSLIFSKVLGFLCVYIGKGLVLRNVSFSSTVKSRGKNLGFSWYRTSIGHVVHTIYQNNVKLRPVAVH